MPFQSEAQRGFMYANHPKIAKRFEKETPADADLPAHVKKMNQGGFADDWKNDLAGYMDEHFGQQQPQNMYDGGMAGGTEDDQAMQSIPDPDFTSNMSMAPAANPVFNPLNGLPPAATPAMSAAPAMPANPMPVQAAVNPLQGYLDQKRALMDKYGPDKEMELERAIQKQRSGFIPVLANASTGLADAIMQGVARAGPSNFQSNLQNRLDKSAEGQRQAFQHAQTGNLAKIKQEMELDSMDPATALSQSVQNANRKTLRGLGYSDSDITQISANMMPEATAKRLTLEELHNAAEANRLKAAEIRATREETASSRREALEQRQREAAETARKNKADEALAIKTGRNKAATDLLTKSGNARIWGIPVPFTSDVSSKDKQSALGVLREDMFEPDVVEYARTHNITPQAAQEQKKRRMQQLPGGQ